MDDIPDLTEVRQEKNANGDVVTYACAYLTSTAKSYNAFDHIEVPAFYDLVYNCAESPEDIRGRVASKLLEAAAERWHIKPAGETCDGIGVFVDNNALVAVSSNPPDSFSTLECQKLNPVGEGQCCIVVESRMTFTPYIPYTEVDFWGWVADEIDALTKKGEAFQTAFIGSQVEAPLDGADLPPAIAAIGTEVAPPQPPNNDEGKFSVVGAITFTGLILTLVGLVLLLIRRRVKYRKATEIDAALSQSEIKHKSLTTDDEEFSGYRVSVLSDDTVDGSLQPNQTTWSYPIHDEDFDPSTGSGLDLSGNFRKDVMGAYGQSPPSNNRRKEPTTIEVVPPYPMEETSDSEADSWAQTDGTVGSLEDRLEEITGEI